MKDSFQRVIMMSSTAKALKSITYETRAGVKDVKNALSQLLEGYAKELISFWSFSRQNKENVFIGQSKK